MNFIRDEKEFVGPSHLLLKPASAVCESEGEISVLLPSVKTAQNFAQKISHGAAFQQIMGILVVIISQAGIAGLISGTSGTVFGYVTWLQTKFRRLTVRWERRNRYWQGFLCLGLCMLWVGKILSTY